jgi:hypothetical protein
MADQRTRRTLIHLMLGASATAAFATEGGGNSYPIGVDNTLSGYMLPEGANWLLFYQHYDATHNKDPPGTTTPGWLTFACAPTLLLLDCPMCGLTCAFLAPRWKHASCSRSA